MKIQILKTGSSGNCYLLSTDSQTLIIDCGVKLAEIKKGLKFDVKRIVGCIVSHSHKDHSLCKEKLANMGCDIFAPYELGEIDRAHTTLGDFNITAFSVPHDDEKNFGFLIEVAGQKILYLTDFEYCRYRFKKQNLNHILIECNYQEENLDSLAPNYKHKIKGHCSLSTCVDFIGVNATDSLRTVLLIHMGSGIEDPMECVREVKTVAKNAFVQYAMAGTEIVVE